jgi:prepilin-type N-terminal cleavage/methylation domain-containing protein
VIFRATTRRAFTLVEVMIVIAIIMVVTTAGIPMVWRALAKDPLAKAVNDVLEGCKTARDRAILQNRPFDFVIRNRDENDAEVAVEPSKIKDSSGLAFPGSATATGSEPGSLIGAFPRKLGADVAVELLAVNFIDHMGASEARVRFYQNGTSDEFTVAFMRNGVRRTITVDIITGAAYEVLK